MDGFIFIIFLLFFVFPILKKINKAARKPAKKPTSKYRNLPKKSNPWGVDHGQVRQERHQQLHSQDNSQVFPEEHAERVRVRDKRDRKEHRRMETNIHSRDNNAMSRVSNKSRLDWGARGESGMTSSKGVAIFFLLLLLTYFIIAAVAPELLLGN